MYIVDETAMLALGQRFGRNDTLTGQRLILFLSGDLGAGKTTLVRGLLRGLGYQGTVKSPTYTIVEPYLLSRINVFHIDLYRLNDPAELEYTGIRDSFSEAALFLIEWPDNARLVLPTPDLEVFITRSGEGRELRIKSCTHWGAQLRSLLPV